MLAPIRVTSPVIEAYKNRIRDFSTLPERLPSAIEHLGRHVADQVLERLLVTSASITTPLGVTFEGVLPASSNTMLVTTKEDHPFLGVSIARELDAQHVGYIHMEGRRGLQALVAPIREMRFPANTGPLDLMVVAKSVIATGCTASTLVRRATEHLQPAKVVIAALFYSERGLRELGEALPNAQIIVLGEPDRLTDDGLLEPGLGILEDRLRSVVDQEPLFAEGRVPPLVQLEPVPALSEAIDQRVANVCEALQKEGANITPADCIHLLGHYKKALLAAQSDKPTASAMDLTEAITEEDVNAVLVRIKLLSKRSA